MTGWSGEWGRGALFRTDDLVLLPKLFRRLADHLRFAPDSSLDCFSAMSGRECPAPT